MPDCCPNHRPLLQQAPIAAGACVALVRPGMALKLPAPTSRTASSTHAGSAVIELGIEIQAEAAVHHVDRAENDRRGQRGAEFSIAINRQLDVVAAIGRRAAIVELALVDEAGRVQRCRRQQRQAEQRLPES